MGFEQAGEVLAGLERADEQQVGRTHTQAGERGPDLVGAGSGDRLQAQRDETQAVGGQACRPRVVQRGLRGAQDGGRVAADAGQAGHERLHTVGGEGLGVVQEGEVVERHHQRRCRPRRHDDGRGVHDVHRAGGPFDGWPAQPPPRFVERGAREGERPHGDRRFEAVDRWSTMPGRDPHQFHVRSRGQLAGQRQRGDRGPSGYVVPALLQRVGDAHPPMLAHAPLVAWPP